MPSSTDTAAVIRRLQDLVHLELDAARACEAAVSRVGDVEAKARITSFRHEHERHAAVLQRCTRDLGGSPPEGPDVRRVVVEGRVVLAGLRGDHAVLSALRADQELVIGHYEDTLHGTRPPPVVRRVLEEGLADARRRQAWVVDRLGLEMA